MTTTRRRAKGSGSVRERSKGKKEALGHGVMWGDLGHNPAERVTPPKVQKTVVKPWDVDTFYKFLADAAESQFVNV